MISIHWIKVKNSNSMIIKSHTIYNGIFTKYFWISKYNQSATVAFSIDTDSINSSV